MNYIIFYREILILSGLLEIPFLIQNVFTAKPFIVIKYSFELHYIGWLK